MAKLFKGVSSKLETLFDLSRLFLEKFRTSEKDTGSDWLTAGLSNRVYRKVLAVAAGPNAGTVNVAHGLTSPSVFIRCYGYLASGTTTRFINSDDGTVILSAHRAGDNIVLTSGSNLSTYAGHVVIEYTY